MADIEAQLKLEVPVVVRVGERAMRLADVAGLAPGSIIELPKRADDELDLMINNKQIGFGHAVKVGENFGIRITYLGKPAERVRAAVEAAEGSDDPTDEEMAEALLAGQV